MFTAHVNGKLTATPLRSPRLKYRVENGTLASRVQRRLDHAGKSARAVSLATKLSDAFVLNILNGKSKSPRAANLAKLAAVLETTSEWLLEGKGPEVVAENVTERVSSAKEPPVPVLSGGLRVLGDVAAGRFLSLDSAVDETVYEWAPITPHPSYPEGAQYGLVVRGTSINQIALDGDILHCVDIQASGHMPQNGELVIVEQIHLGGHMRERTAKVLKEVGDERFVELWPDSDDPKWQEPILVPHRVYSHHVEPDLKVEIRAFVIGSYRPMQSRRAFR